MNNKFGEMTSSNGAARIHANKLPAEIVGRFVQNLSVGDRLKNERVSPHWERSLREWGWTEQRKLNWDIVFEGVPEEEIFRIRGDAVSGNGGGISRHLITSLFHRCEPWFREFDFCRFGERVTEGFIPQIVESLPTLKLEKLDIQMVPLAHLLDHLPPNLRSIRAWGSLSADTLEALSLRCPDMEDVPFFWTTDVDTLVRLIGKFPRQKTLVLRHGTERQGAFASIGELKGLEKLDLEECEGVDEASLRAIAEGCQWLRSIRLNTIRLADGGGAALFQLTKMRALTELEIVDHGDLFSDSFLMEIAQRGQLRKLYARRSEVLTDDSIVYLVEKCKSLVSLFVLWCPLITERSLEAVVAEIRRRHGSPPRALPRDVRDPRIFYFGPTKSSDNDFNGFVDAQRAIEIIGDGNPWMISYPHYDPREII